MPGYLWTEVPPRHAQLVVELLFHVQSGATVERGGLEEEAGVSCSKDLLEPQVGENFAPLPDDRL